MKNLLFVVLFLLVVNLNASNELIRSRGNYLSPNGKSKVAVLDDRKDVVILFSFVGPDLRVTSIEHKFDSGKKWACFISDEMTLWVYKGGDRVVSSTIVEKSGAALEFSALNGVFDVKADRNLIPKILIEFIER
jgi:hypothetical protein